MNISIIKHIKNHHSKLKLLNSFNKKNVFLISMRNSNSNNRLHNQVSQTSQTTLNTIYKIKNYSLSNTNKENNTKDEGKTNEESTSEDSKDSENQEEHKAKFKTSRIIWNYICKIWNYSLSVGFLLFLYNYYIYKIKNKDEYMKNPLYIIYFHKTILFFKGTKDYVKQVSHIINILYIHIHIHTIYIHIIEHVSSIL